MILSAINSSTEPNQSSECHINDDIEGVAIPVDEWIAKELARIKEQQEPRHCHDYEALIEVIEEISRIPACMLVMKRQQNYNTDPTTSENDDNNGSAVTLPCGNVLEQPSRSLLLSSPPISPTATSSLMILLDRAFVSLWKYCCDDQYAPHHAFPVGLLLDIEKITLLLNPNSINNNNYSKNDDMTHSGDFSSSSGSIQNHPLRKKKKSSMQLIQAQLSKAFYIQTPPPPDAVTSCSPWLPSFQVIQQWIFPLSIPASESSNITSDTTTTKWYSSLITGTDANRSAKLSLPLASRISHSSLTATSTVDHLEQLMQKTHL
ncbi:hypothetical protein BCR42DRAFT_425761 [Absidia repens]|uniref:Uncharacterized protein n=1 Tax=Absidia repens TaxID=90262 RepID=A0A1X2I1Y8_9FUNG|nr:hypothetical protein BCR42DRAFT_425761 [Absidia repens]